MVSACSNHLLSQPMWLVLVSSLGLLSFLQTSTSLLKWVYATFLRPKKNLRDYGSWALITGATDGIGKAFAHQLAQKDPNLILVGRNPTKLETVSREIQAEHPGTKNKTVVFDFSSKASAGVRSTIEKATEGLDVGLLINNLGITVTKAVLAGMIKRKRGAIINIGSGAASAMPSHPLFTIYAATKAYIDQLSRCLYVEYKRCGIHVQCQKSSLFIPSPEADAEAAIGRVGYEARCAPYWAHSFQWWLACLLPERVLDAWRLSVGIHRRGNEFEEICS
ncbi:hypothetical protein POTOM_032157 [Populus tomentosa]|uniref:Uncharacterized protein n=1 Tax=Populus tomentosa TaxID=118781 RepID=A0A8X8CIZ5_POPTO|nr:hypothetical protein POTOM_032157 [Populus tomentosa]